MLGSLDIHPHHAHNDDWGSGPCTLTTAVGALGIQIDPVLVARRTCSKALDGTSTGLIMSVARGMGLKASASRGVSYRRLAKWISDPTKSVIGYLRSKDRWICIPWCDPDQEVVWIIDPLSERSYSMEWADKDLGLWALILRDPNYNETVKDVGKS